MVGLLLGTLLVNIKNIISKCRNKIILIEARKPLLCSGKSRLNARVSIINAVSQ
ncbi:hypothetical protein [Coxiella endosymbiont of Rhipicephalus microplus]|uniref:hypothetical protein n=1 Tax=Coxiella endosymbiont of Rhipicephalus microplus TaxID=1656186 RepID=UPI0012FFEEEB|nr:hypothetical protein [Coxiella endosymbiont of Rhipicephalus microplus]